MEDIVKLSAPISLWVIFQRINYLKVFAIKVGFLHDLQSQDVIFDEEKPHDILHYSHNDIWVANSKYHIAILGLSWNLSLAENLTSLSLQDGPQSGIIISLVQYNLPNIQYNLPNIPPPPPNSLCLLTWISQQVLVGSFPNLKLKHRDQTEIEICLKWRRHQMEDNLKIFIVEYLSNHS